MFGIYARNIIAGQGRYVPDRSASTSESSNSLTQTKEPIMAKTVARKTATQSLSLIHRSNVNGLSFSDYALSLPHLENGVELLVVAHDDNKHDDKAVALYLPHADGEWEVDGQAAFHVGWLPNNLDESKGAKKILWTLLDKGFNLRAKILNHDKNANFQSHLFIGIWLEH